MNRSPRDPLDELLEHSAAPVATGTTLSTELALLATRTRRSAARRRFPVRRAAIGGVIALLAGGGTAAAAAAGGWVPWIDDPDLIFEYQLPSGQLCQMAIGNVDADGREDVVDAVEDILRNGHVYERADIAGQLAEPLQSDYPAGSDVVYQTAMIIAINEVIWLDLYERVPDAGGFEWYGDDSCYQGVE